MKTFFTLAALLCAFLAASARAPANAPGCTGENYRSFDFMIGTWVGTHRDGEVRGKAEVTRVLAGCSVRMHWTGRTFEGTNNNAYDATRGIWQKAWFDNTGGIELSEGHAISGRLVYRGVDYDRGKVVSLHRESWILLRDGRVLEHYELSADAGKTWRTAFDTYYKRIDRRAYDALRIVQDQ